MFRFFKCNKLGGFRLSDLSRKIRTDEYFYIDKYVCDTSRSVKAALNAKWMLEVTEEEAAKHNSVVKTPDLHRKDKVTPKLPLSKSSINAKETNKKLESRQIAKSIKQPMQKQKEEDKVIVPNFVEADKKIKDRQADITTTGKDEILKSPVQAKVAEALKNKVQAKNIEASKSTIQAEEILKSAIEEKVVEILENPVQVEEIAIEEKVLENTVKAEEQKKVEILEVDSKDFVENLAKDIGADNSQMSAPNFDEKKQEVKQEIKQQVEKRIRRRKKQENQEV